VLVKVCHRAPGLYGLELKHTSTIHTLSGGLNFIAMLSSHLREINYGSPEYGENLQF